MVTLFTRRFAALSAFLVFWLWCGVAPVFPDWILEIDDPLTNGKTVGRQGGGRFSAHGWTTETRWDHIQYNIETCPYGKIEFDVQGLYASNEVFPNIEYHRGVPTGDEDMHYTLFNMWDRDEHDEWFGQTINGIRQWHNPWKCLLHIFGYVVGDRYKWEHGRFRLNVGAYSGGYDDDPHAFELEYGPVHWQKEQIFHVRLEWGNGHMYYLINDKIMQHADYSSFGTEYAPPYHSMRIGSAETGCKGFDMQVPIQITYKNFKFYRNFDITPPRVTSFTPGDRTVDNKIDSYISLTISESFDFASAQAAFTLVPHVEGQLVATGTTLYYELAELLSPNTSYNVTLSEALMDQAGNHMEHPFTATFSTGSAEIKKVEKNGLFELPIVAPGISGNKYKDVKLHGVFRGPTQTIDIDGFWNGGDVWKIRMMPTEAGQWTYTLSGSHNAFSKSGSFTVVQSAKKGHIRANPDHPYTFMWDDGTPWMWHGETSWRLFTQLYPYNSRFKEYIDYRHAQGYNAVQAIVVSYINGDAFWANEGGTVFALTQDGKDYDHLNPGYFQWMDRRIEYMNSLDMAPVIFFTWAQEFVKFSDVQFKRFVEYMVARFAAYNVFWCLSGEHSEVYVDFGLSPSVWRQHGRTVAAADPYDHPVTLHPGGNSRSSAEFANDDWFGFIMHQSPDFHSLVLKERIYAKPVVNGEYAYAGWTADDNWLRYGAWEIFTAGGFSTAGFFTTFAPDKGGYDLYANMQQQQEMEYFHNFTKQIAWWSMQPHDEIVSKGCCLANPGSEYVVYSRDGGSTSVKLTAVTGDLKVRWLNPKTGDYSTGATVFGGGTVSLTPPFNGEWVLHLGGEFDMAAPAAPTGLVLQERE